MPRNYWYHCDSCDYRAERYRNVRRCKCGGNLIREEPQINPLRIVIETEQHSYVSCVRAERPGDVVVVVLGGDETKVFGDNGLPIEPLAVAPEEVKE